MLRNKGLDIRGVVEQTLRILISSENSSEKEELGQFGLIDAMEKVMFGDRLFNRVKESDFVVFGGMSKGSETRERDWHKNLQIAYEKGKKLFGTN